MGQLKGAILATIAALICCVQPSPAQKTQLFSQAAKSTLDRLYARPDLSYLLLDDSGHVLAERWQAEQHSTRQAISPGSLVKPFLAVAYGEQHHGEFPSVRCMGTQSHCWLPAGHGVLGLEEAIVESCNSYFLALARDLDRARAAQTFARYGLSGPSADATPESLIGLGPMWQESPLALVHAYQMLLREHHASFQSRIVKGMAGAASRGTARGVDAALGANAALAKTGTAPCSHTPAGAGDGLTVILYPAQQPRLLLLVRVHGITGAEAATIAGEMLRSLGAGAAP